MRDDVEKAVLKTLCYSDIFDYPLTKDEIWKFLISSKKISKKAFETCFGAKTIFYTENKFYCLQNRIQVINKRIKKEKTSREKLKIAREVASILFKIPSVKLIGISGNLSMNNAGESDDIDLFIITKKNTIWITRFFVILILSILGKRRKRKQKEVKNKICINMFMDEESLFLPQEKRNLYIAHEVVQMMPLFDRENTYYKYIVENDWVREYLSNSINVRALRDKGIKKEKKLLDILTSQYLSIFISALEYLTKRIQLWFINKHKTTETISDNLLAFHPVDYKNRILKAYDKRLKYYKIK